jgi:hypothetical protein
VNERSHESSESSPNVSFHPWYRRKRGGLRDLEISLSGAPPFPKNPSGRGMKERKSRKNKNRKAVWKRSHRTFLP